MKDCPCRDCGVETHNAECYIVEDDVWRSVVPFKTDGGVLYLCIGCLETRLGRKLTPRDFSLVPLNFASDECLGRSKRLIDRMGGRFKDEKVIKDWLDSEKEKYGLNSD